MYNTNPFAPKARRLAVNDVRVRRLSVTQAGHKYGVARSTVYRWIAKATPDHKTFIPTGSSRPHTHPQQLPPATVARVLALRHQLGRCAPVLHAHLRAEGHTISRSSVERILRRHHLTRRKRQAKGYAPVPRPKAQAVGSLVQMDTIHYVRANGSRFYLYTLIDVYSRQAYCQYAARLSWRTSLEVILAAQTHWKVRFTTVQTDNGPEFRGSFARLLHQQRIALRHSRVRRPNDNAHIERFNRTLQEECFRGRHPNEKTAPQELHRYLEYYNGRRLHLGLQLQTPATVAKVVT